MEQKVGDGGLREAAEGKMAQAGSITSGSLMARTPDALKRGSSIDLPGHANVSDGKMRSLQGSMGGESLVPAVHQARKAACRTRAAVITRLITVAMMAALIIVGLFAWYFTTSASADSAVSLGADLRKELLCRTYEMVVSTFSTQLFSIGVVAGAVENLYATSGALHFPAMESEVQRLGGAIYLLQPSLTTIGCTFEDGRYSTYIPGSPGEDLQRGDICPSPCCGAGADSCRAAGKVGGTSDSFRGHDQSTNPIPLSISFFNNQSVPYGVIPPRYMAQIPRPHVGPARAVEELSNSSWVDLRKEPWYTKAVATPSRTAGYLLLDREPRFATSFAVHTPHQGLLGVCSATQSLDVLNRLLGSLDLKGGVLYLLNDDGSSLVASSNSEPIPFSPIGVADGSLDPLVKETWDKLMDQRDGLGQLPSQLLSFDVSVAGIQYYVNAIPMKTKTLPITAVLAVPRSSSMVAAWRFVNHGTFLLTALVVWVVCLVGCLGILLVMGPVVSQLQMHEQLVELKEKAEYECKAKSQFLANCSHELRTPMAAIIGLLDLHLSDDLAAEQRATVEKIRSSATSLLAMLNDILDFAKVEAGGLHLERANFDLEAELESLVEVFCVQYQKKGLELVLDLADRPDWMVTGDSARVRQIFTNLLHNAYKFTPQGGQVWLRGMDSDLATTRNASKQSSRGAGKDLHLAFEVDDTGCGVPVNKRKKVFERFSQADVSTTRMHGGTGLGLAIVSNLVSLMGGSIAILDKERPGTLIGFDLRFAPPTQSRRRSHLDSLSLPLLLESHPGAPHAHTANPESPTKLFDGAQDAIPVQPTPPSAALGPELVPRRAIKLTRFPAVTRSSPFPCSPLAPPVNASEPQAHLKPTSDQDTRWTMLEGTKVLLCMAGQAERSMIAGWFRRRGLETVLIEEYDEIVPTLGQLLPQFKGVKGCEDAFPTKGPPSWGLTRASEGAGCGKVLAMVDVTLCPLYTQFCAKDGEGSQGASGLREATGSMLGGDGQQVHLTEVISQVPSVQALMRFMNGAARRPDLAQIAYCRITCHHLPKWLRTLKVPNWLVVSKPLYGSRLRALADATCLALASQADSAVPRTGASNKQTSLTEEGTPGVVPAAPTVVWPKPLEGTDREFFYCPLVAKVTSALPRDIAGAMLRESGGVLLGLSADDAQQNTKAEDSPLDIRPGEWRVGYKPLTSTPAASMKSKHQLLSGYRVLVVEDTELLRQIAIKTLQKLGAEVAGANDGNQAVDAVLATQNFGGTARNFDAVLMDCQMPNLNGYGATRTIRQAASENAHRLPIIALTAHADFSNDRRKCLEAGMDEYLVKPVTAKVLAGTIRTICNKL